MSRVLGINAVFHDPAAALVVDGEIVAAAEEERFSRRKHGKTPVPFSTWELPEQADRASACERAGLRPGDLDAVAYSYDPALRARRRRDITADGVGGPADAVRRSARRASCATALPGLDPESVALRRRTTSRTPPRRTSRRRATRCAVLVLDGRGERASHLAGRFARRRARGARHAGACRTRSACSTRSSPRTSASGARSDEYKVMALASYGEPAPPRRARRSSTPTATAASAPSRSTSALRAARCAPGGESRAGARRPRRSRAARAWRRSCSTSRAGCTGAPASGARAGRRRRAQLRRQLAAAGAKGPFERVWVQPAAGDVGHGARRRAAGRARARATRVRADAHGRARAASGTTTSWRGWLQRAGVAFERPDDIADGGRRGARRRRRRRLVPGPQRVRPARARAPQPARRPAPAREPRAAQRRQGPRAVPAGRADGARRARRRDLRAARSRRRTCSSSTTCGRSGGSASRPSCTSTARRASRPSTAADEPLVARMLDALRGAAPACRSSSTRRSTPPGRPMVDDPRDALECFGSAPVDAARDRPVRCVAGRRARARRAVA